MEAKKEMLERKLRDAKERLAKIEVDYEKFLKVQKDREHLKKRIDKITKLLSEE